MMSSPGDWTPQSWRNYPIKQQPIYPDEQQLEVTLQQIRSLPPLVTPQEVDNLRNQLAEVAEGKRFLLQGGDCAERFVDCSSDSIEKRLKILLQMSLVLTWGARMPTVRIARMAGQFAKPRSKDTEIVDGVEVPAFRGDNVNSFDVSNRLPDPNRLLQGYFHSTATLNYARAVLSSGFGDLREASNWELDFVQDTSHRSEYSEMVSRILSAMDFMRVCGVGIEEEVHTAPVFISHEGLQLSYEEALTRRVVRNLSSTTPSSRSSTPKEGSSHVSSGSSDHGVQSVKTVEEYYNLGSHFLWIGDRTRQLDHAHAEYFRGIRNPIGIKVGPSSDPEEIVQLVRNLCVPPPLASSSSEMSPSGIEKGRIVIITRMGMNNVEKILPKLISVFQREGIANDVVWTCDPMHGNTTTSSNGFKTRSYLSILGELRHTFEVHKQMGSIFGGVHFELTGEHVTECVGGPEKLEDCHLPLRYDTYCDPRLNYAQSLEVAFLIAQYLSGEEDEKDLSSLVENGAPSETAASSLSAQPRASSFTIGGTDCSTEIKSENIGSPNILHFPDVHDFYTSKVCGHRDSNSLSYTASIITETSVANDSGNGKSAHNFSERISSFSSTSTNSSLSPVVSTGNNTSSSGGITRVSSRLKFAVGRGLSPQPVSFSVTPVGSVPPSLDIS